MPTRIRALAATLALPLALAACGFGPYERAEQSCLNHFAGVDDRSQVVRPLGAGFELTGDPQIYRPMVITQTAAPLRPGTAGDPAADYPSVSMRAFHCEPVVD